MKKLALSLISFLFIGNIFAQHADLEKSIQSIIKNKKATVGVSVIFDNNTTLAINNTYHYPTMSVFKFPLALTVLSYLEKNHLTLDSPIFINKTDLLPETYSPLRDDYPQGDMDISIKDLLIYSVSKSDNNACDILLKYIGGTAIVDKYIKDLGIYDINIIANEAIMNENPENQYLNWTTPSATTFLLKLFLSKDLLSATNKSFLKKTMEETITGANKIKGSLPKETVVGHKTGSSSRNDFNMKIGENDLGYVKATSGKEFIIGVYVMNSMEDDATNSAIIADISKAVYDYYNK